MGITTIRIPRSVRLYSDSIERRLGKAQCSMMVLVLTKVGAMLQRRHRLAG